MSGVLDDTGTLREARLRQARAEAPTALALGGGAVGVAIVLDLAVRGFGVTSADAWHLLSVGVFLAAWALVRTDAVSDAAVPWIMGVGAVVLVVSLLASAVAVEQDVALAYVLLAMLAYGPFVLDTRAMVVVAVPMLASYVYVVDVLHPDLYRQWIPVAFVAILVGFAIQRMRMRAIADLARANKRAHDLATRDELTRLLNRVGLDEALPSLIAGAARHEETVFAVFVDVDGLKAANDQFGHDHGDDVIRRVAGVLRSQVRANDLVVRWGGDEFLVVGSGTRVDAQSWEDRLNSALADPGAAVVGAGWRPARVSVGAAEAEAAADLDFAALLQEADSRMYERRRRRRSGSSRR